MRFLVHRGNAVYIVNNILTLQSFEGEKGKKRNKEITARQSASEFREMSTADEQVNAQLHLLSFPRSKSLQIAN